MNRKPRRVAARIAELLAAGLRHHRLGQLAEAEVRYNEILAIDPNHVDGLHLLGVVAHQSGRQERAIDLIGKAIALNDRVAAFHHNMGLALHKLGRPQEAMVHHTRAIELKPDYVEAHHNLANCLKEQGRVDAALGQYERVLALRPDYAEAHNNLGNTLREQGQLHKAIGSYQQALALSPQYAEAHNNLGVALQEQGKLEEAVVRYQRALALRPDFAEAHRGEAQLRLLLGDFERGLPKFEWRSRVAERQRAFVQPLWLGKGDLAGRTILLHTDYGFGDAIQFSRYAGKLAQTGAQVILEVRPPLKALMLELDAPVGVLARGEPLPPFEFHCPVMSLPLALGTRINTIPANVPYLRPPADRREHWGTRIPKSESLRVGLVWCGSNHGRADRRPIPLEQLTPLLSLPGIRFVSLQKNIRSADAGALRRHSQIIEVGNELRDFADTAAVVAQLDLVVSIDTAVAHLAGAMGKPVYILLPDPPSWRWLLDREDSPWYPTARLFRQRTPGDWNDVVSRVAQAIGSLLDGREKLRE
jgi:tetratricopeptide (TPR) repeat protein